LRITPPTIGRLLGISRQMAHRRVIAGDFGAVVTRRDHAQLVDLAAVQDALGIEFTPTQLAAAGLPIPHEEEAADGPIAA